MSRKALAALEENEGWELDMFSTMLSRKHSYHKMVGKLRLVKVRREHDKS